MLRTLFDAPFPDAISTLPPEIQGRAETEIRKYWISRGWQLVLGEVVLWAAVVFVKHEPDTNIYLGLAALIAVAYFLVVQTNTFVWLIGTLVLFGIQGFAVSGLGAVTALSYMLPYTIASMVMSGNKRLMLQSICVLAFWTSLVYEILPVFPQIEPSRYVIVSYNILIAAFTFQSLRFLNQLAVTINSDYVSSEVKIQSQQFLARVSHELRTPLNSMLGFSKLLRRADLSERHQEYLHQVIEEGEQLNRLVSDLLDSAHLSTGKLTLMKEDCDINDICRSVAEEHRPSLAENITLITDFAPNMPAVYADPTRLRQIIGNLFANAVKHTHSGSITLRTARKDNLILIDVIDTGSGISEEQQQIIFVPFVQLDTRRAGVGLGLDIALQLARLHGGDIKLHSVVGQGSTFTIELPA